MASRTPARRRTRGTLSGGISRRMARDWGSLKEQLRLLGYAGVEVVGLLRWVVWTVLAKTGTGSNRGAFEALRHDTDQQRAWASRRLGRELRTSYRQLPAPRSGEAPPVATQLEDPARARDVDWHLLNPLATAVGSLLPLGLIASGAAGLGSFVVFLASLWGTSGPQSPDEWLPPHPYYYWGFDNNYTPLAPPLFGLAQLILAPIVARLVQRLHARWVASMLATDVSASLEERVLSLTETRKTALELQEAEIQRIERDLHDGAQARLVTMGMSLTQASRLLHHDPDGALVMLEAAKADSATALKELRTLVRGIRPPVLADRGLADALRSLAASGPVDTSVRSSLPERLVPTLETALYFAVAELLANATKHSAASQVVIELSADDAVVTAVVTDNGIGGAEESAAGGLAGIRRRLAPFDGSMEFISPVGGPTVVTVRVPRPQ